MRREEHRLSASAPPGEPCRRGPLTLPDDLLEGLPLQPVPPPQLRRDVPLPWGETGSAQPRRHLRGEAGRGSGGERPPGPRRAAEGRGRRAGRRRRPVPGPRRGKCGGEERPLRIGARHAATAPRPPWRCGRALSGALAPQRRTAMATEAAPTLPDAPLPPASTAASHTALAPQHQAAPRRGRSASTVPASPTRRAGTLLRRGGLAPRHFVAPSRKRVRALPPF